jgi:pilus assembly protein CpaE
MSYIKQSMLAGAKEFLVKPLLPEELNTCIKKVADLNRQRLKVFKGDTDVFIREKAMPGANNKLVCVYGTKGGVGKSVICTNLAVEMARRYKNKVSLIDLDLQFGDVCILMDLNPRKTVSELMQEGDMIDEELLEDYMYERNGVHVLAPPNKPELSELVTSDGVQKILSLCRDLYTYTFIDTPSFIDETTLTALEMADAVLLVISLDLPTIKNVKKGLDVLKTLKLLPKTRLILNRSSGVAGIEAMDVEKILDMKIKGEVPSDGKLVVSSVNKGIPFVKLNPKAPITKSLLDIINMLENWSSKK